MERRLEPEILDSLPHEHPDALHNRRDLRVVNRLMGNFRWFEATLPKLMRDSECALELGAGTGELGRLLARRGVSVAGLDLWPRPANWPPGAPWFATDLRTFERYSPFSVIFGNLIFHQFDAAELQALGKKLQEGARVLLASEPARRRRSQILYRAVAPVLGANHVTRHDAHVSIAAGFCGDELPMALGLARSDWDVRCSTNAFGAYRMIALRRA